MTHIPDSFENELRVCSKLITETDNTGNKEGRLCRLLTKPHGDVRSHRMEFVDLEARFVYWQLITSVVVRMWAAWESFIAPRAASQGKQNWQLDLRRCSLPSWVPFEFAAFAEPDRHQNIKSNVWVHLRIRNLRGATVFLRLFYGLRNIVAHGSSKRTFLTGVLKEFVHGTDFWPVAEQNFALKGVGPLPPEVNSLIESVKINVAHIMTKENAVEGEGVSRVAQYFARLLVTWPYFAPNIHVSSVFLKCMSNFLKNLHASLKQPLSSATWDNEKSKQPSVDAGSCTQG